MRLRRIIPVAAAVLAVGAAAPWVLAEETAHGATLRGAGPENVGVTGKAGGEAGIRTREAGLPHLTV